MSSYTNSQIYSLVEYLSNSLLAPHQSGLADRLLASSADPGLTDSPIRSSYSLLQLNRLKLNLLSQQKLNEHQPSLSLKFPSLRLPWSRPNSMHAKLRDNVKLDKVK